MEFHNVKSICFTICIVCVICLVLLGLLLIWGGIHSEFAWRVAMTLGLFFLAASVTLTVASRMEKN